MNLSGLYVKENKWIGVQIMLVEKFDNLYYITVETNGEKDSILLDDIDTKRWKEAQHWEKIAEIEEIQ